MKTGVSLVRIQTEELTAEHPDVAVPEASACLLPFYKVDLFKHAASTVKARVVRVRKIYLIRVHKT